MREAVGDVYRYALALTVSTARAEQLTAAAALRLARHVDAVGAAPGLHGPAHPGRPARGARRPAPAPPPPPARRERGGADPRRVGQGLPLPCRRSPRCPRRSASPSCCATTTGCCCRTSRPRCGVGYAEAEVILGRARDGLAPTIGAFDDGTGADPYGRLLRGVPGPPDSLADRVWVSVDAALGAGLQPRTGGWLAPDDDPLGWEGFGSGPVEEHHVPPAKEARRVGTTLLVGAGALAALLGVAMLTAPSRGSDDASAVAGTSAASGAGSEVPATSSPPATTVAAVATTVRPGLGRASQAPAVPDLVIDAGHVLPHSPDQQEPAATESSATLPESPRLADVAVSVRNHSGTSAVVVRRVDSSGGSEVWLLSVHGQVRPARVDAPDLLQAWTVDGGGVVVALRVAGDPDARVLVGLRAGGGGTWLRVPDGAQPLGARPDGSVVCLEPSDAGAALTTYQVLALTGLRLSRSMRGASRARPARRAAAQAGARRTARSAARSGGWRCASPRCRPRAARAGRPRDVEPVGVERVGRGQVADGGLDGLGIAGDPLEHPLQDPAVLAVARPEEAAVLVAAEPVDEEDLRQLAGVGLGRRWPASGRSSRPCCSRRRAAWPSGRSAGCRRHRRPQPWSPRP